MALLFSAVRATANDQEVEFFVGGIPREYDDLEGWTAFDRFMGEIDKETEVAVHAESYLYGEEETYRATPEEVAYFMKRIEMDDTFLSRCDNIESVDFTINWSPEELFNMEVPTIFWSITKNIRKSGQTLILHCLPFSQFHFCKNTILPLRS